MKKKTKQSTASMPEDTVPLLSEYEGDLEEFRTVSPKKATKSPATPNKSFLHKGKHGTPAEDTIPLLSEYEGDLEEFGTVSPAKTTKGFSIPKIPNSSISYSKLKNEDDVSAKKALGSSSSSDLGSDSGVGSSTSSGKTSVRKGIKAALKKTITAFNKNAKKEQASSSERSSSPSGAQPTTWYVNPLDVSDVDSEPGQAKHWAPVEDLLGDEFDAFARSRLSSASASSDFEFRTGEQYYGALDRQSDSVIEPIYETLDPHWQERANVAPEPAYATPRSAQPVGKNAAAKVEPAYDTPRNSQQPVSKNAAARAEPAYDTPRNSQQPVSKNAAAKAEPIYETIDQFRHEHAGAAKGPTVASQTRSATPRNAQAGNRSGQVVVNGSIYDVPDPVAVYDTPQNLKPVSKNAAAKAEPTYDTPRSAQPVSKNAAAKAEPIYETIDHQPVGQNAAARAEPTYDTPRNSQIVTQPRSAASARSATSAPKPPVPPRTVTAPAVAPRKASGVEEQKSTTPGSMGNAPSAQQPTQNAAALATKAASSTTKTADHTMASAKLVTAQPFRGGAAATLKSVTPPVAAPRKVLDTGGEQKSPAPRNVSSTPGMQQPAPEVVVAPAARMASSTSRATGSATTSTKLMAAQPFRGEAATLKSVTPPVAAPRKVLGTGEQKPSPSTLQNMSNVPEYSKNVVPSVRQRKAMLSDKIGQVTEAGLQSPKRSAQSESTVRETGATMPAAKPAVAPKPAVAAKPAVAPKPVVAPKPAVAAKPAVAPKPVAASALNAGSTTPGVRQGKAMSSDKIGQVTEAGLQSPKRSAQSESTAREIQDVRKNSAQTRESRAEFASRLNALLTNRNTFAQEASKAEKPKVVASTPKLSTPAAPAQIDFNELKSKAAAFSAALAEKTRAESAEQKSPTVGSSATPPSVVAKKPGSAPVHENARSTNPGFVDELKKVLANRNGSSQIDKPATAAKTSAQQASVAQQHGDVTGSRTADASAQKISKISANPAFAGAIPTLERMLAERQSTQQAGRGASGHPDAQKTLGNGISYSDMVSTGRQGAPSMGNLEGAGRKSPASAEKAGRSASTSSQKDGEVQTQQGKHVSSLMRGFDSSSATPPARGAAR